MSPRSAGRTLIACIVVLGVSSVRADLPRVEQPDVRATDAQIRFVRRPVAVVDLSNDQGVRDVANKLLDLLASHTELAPPAISDGAALVDRLPLEDEGRLTEAQRKRTAAEQNLLARDFAAAAKDAHDGQVILQNVNPRVARSLYADLGLALGQALLGDKKDAQARESFALTYRLDPRRTLDELHYLPEVVQMFEAVKKVNPGVGRIHVRGAGRVWIDGEEVGAAPGTFPASIGLHVVWLTDLLRETLGKEVVVTATQPGDATIVDAALPRPRKVVRYRTALADAQDPATRASAMKALAAFVNVHDAVLLSSSNGKISWQTWRDSDEGFGPIKELGRDNPTEILKQLAPPPVADVPEPPAPMPAAPIVVPRWYQHRPVQLGIAAAIVAALVGGYMWVHYSEPDRPWNPDIGKMPSTSRP
jgi:hypothetical protein